jgi:hypothetical protein
MFLHFLSWVRFLSEDEWGRDPVPTCVWKATGMCSSQGRVMRRRLVVLYIRMERVLMNSVM